MHLTRALLFSCLLAGSLFSGCQRFSGSGSDADVKRMGDELEALRQKLAASEKALAAKEAEFSAVVASADEAAAQKAEQWQAALAEKETELSQLKASQAEANNAGLVEYAEASAFKKKGVTTVALERYEQFIRNHPESPLVVDAQRAVTELTVTAAREAERRANLIDPKHAERESLKRFNARIATVEELIPVLKGQSRDAVVRLLGAPDRTYRNNTEIGYVDRIIDRATGNKATFVVRFSNDRVAGVRVGYAGREITP